MAQQTLFVASIAQGGFYVPQFELKIQGVGLPQDVVRDVKELTYKDDVKAIDNFEITVNNWDADTRDFKYVGAETAADLSGPSPNPMYTLFEPCNKQVQVLMGYVGNLQTMLNGDFTTMEPSFTAGASTLTVRGLNVLHQLRRKQYTTSWQNKKDSDIAENIATLTDGGQKRFPLPIVTDSTAKQTEPILPIVSQQNQYDIEFLYFRARERGYVIYIQEANTQGNNPRQLYFGPSDSSQAPQIASVTYILEWGKSLIEFKPSLTTARQVKSVTVNGWNRGNKSAISSTVSLDDPELKTNKDLYRLLQRCDPREQIVVDEPVTTAAEARRRALAILNDSQKEMVKASVTTVGLPNLRAGQRVIIAGVGARMSGSYFVTDSTHTINDSGYITTFNARRENPSIGSGS